MIKIFGFLFVLMNCCVSSDLFFNDYKDVLSRIREESVTFPTCFISRSTNDPAKNAQDFVIGSLISSGLRIISDEPGVVFLNNTLNVNHFLQFGSHVDSFMRKIEDVDFVAVLNTQKYLERSKSADADAGVPQELEHIYRRIGQDPEPSFLISLLLEGTKTTSVPIRMSRYLFNPCVDENGIFDQKICALQTLLLLQQKFYKGNDTIFMLISFFLGKFYSESEVKGTERVYLKKPKELINNLMRISMNQFLYQSRIQKDGKNYLDVIEEALKVGDANICGVNLKGTGGIGKSTLAYEYAKKKKGEYDIIWAFPCETTEGFEESLKSLYKKLSLSGVVETLSIETLQRDVYEHIEQSGRKYLLIYDNVVDQESVLSKIMKRPSKNGHILVTSRQALRGTRIDVGVFNEKESIECLKEMIAYCRPDYDKPLNEDDLKTIASLLDNLPLAIIQASSYIATENILLEEFITKFNEKDKSLLGYDDRQQSIPRSFYAMFSLSFDALNESEKTFLFKLCYLSPDDISTAFFDNDKKVLTKLKDYSLIDMKNGSISLHRLLQLVGRERSEKDKERIINELFLHFETVLEDHLPKYPKEGFNLLENMKRQLISLKQYTQFENFENLLKQVNDQQFDYLLECLDEDNINEKASDLLIRQYLEFSEKDFSNQKNRLQGILDCFTRASDRFEVISLGIDIRDEDLDELKSYFFKMKGENSDKGLLHGFFSLCLTKKSEWKTKYEYFKSQGVWFDNIYDQIAFNENIIGDEYKLSGTKKGVEWLKRSAKKGSKFAQYNLGVFYEKAKGVKQDFKKAVKWYEKAEKQGHISSKFNLGICYECGRGVEKNFGLAFSLYEKAAESGHIRAQYNLSLCYENGIGTPKNTTESLKWLETSAKGGNPKAQYNLAVKFEQEKKYKEALELYESANKDKDATYKAGMYYYEGTGVKKDFKKAFDFFSLAMRLGSEISQVNLGILYTNGHGVKQNYKNAISLWESLPHSKEALYQLGKAYYYGNGVTQSIEKGFKLIKKSADLGECLAHSFLKEIYERYNRQDLYRLALILLDKTDSNTYDPFEGTVLLIKAVKNRDKDAQKKLLELLPAFKFDEIN